MEKPYRQPKIIAEYIALPEFNFEKAMKKAMENKEIEKGAGKTNCTCRMDQRGVALKINDGLSSSLFRTLVYKVQLSGLLITLSHLT